MPSPAEPRHVNGGARVPSRRLPTPS
jgi:hypothetical protein